MPPKLRSGRFKASDALIAKGKRIAAQVLEAAEHDIEFSAGTFTVKGTDRAIGLFEVAREALVRNDPWLRPSRAAAVQPHQRRRPALHQSGWAHLR